MNDEKVTESQIADSTNGAILLFGGKKKMYCGIKMITVITQKTGFG